jgi:hypothetical protein
MIHKFDGPYTWFTPPGLVRISTRAMDLARDFAAQAAQQAPDKDWVVAFNWADSRQYRDILAGMNWMDLGPGLDVVAYERREVPPQAIDVVEEMDVFVVIPSSILDRSSQKLIDVDEEARLVLL